MENSPLPRKSLHGKFLFRKFSHPQTISSLLKIPPKNQRKFISWKTSAPRENPPGINSFFLKKIRLLPNFKYYDVNT